MDIVLIVVRMGRFYGGDVEYPGDIGCYFYCYIFFLQMAFAREWSCQYLLVFLPVLILPGERGHKL
jgi:hypothetical protein